MTAAARVCAAAVARAVPMLAAAAAALAGCGADPQTGLVAEVTTDLVVPGELDELRVAVTAPDGSQLYQQTFPLGDGAGRRQLPMRVGFFPQGGGLDPIRIEAAGWLGTMLVVSRSATLAFLRGRVVVVPLPLLAVCAGKPCAQADQTCIETGRCEGNAVDPASLAPYHPGAHGDAGGPDGGSGSGGGDARDGSGGAAGDAAAADARDAPPPEAGAPDTRPADGPPTDQGRPDDGHTDAPPAERADAAPAADARPETPPPPPPSGLVGYWTFDQQGTVYPDRSGNGNDARVNTASPAPPTWLATLGGRAGVVRIDSSQSWLEVAASSSLNTITPGFTMAAWLYIQSRPGAIEQAIATRQIGSTSAYGLGVTAAGTLECLVETSAALSTALPLATWVHVAASYDGQSINLYVGGVQQPPTYALSGPPLAPTQKPFIIGALNSDFAGIYEELQGGALDDVALYNRALGAAEIAALAAGNVPGLP